MRAAVPISADTSDPLFGPTADMGVRMLKQLKQNSLTCRITVEQSG
jgi:hypothetical protein